MYWCEGWASPLKGFMRESVYLQTLHFNSIRLEDGSVVNMSVPIVLAIDDSQKNQISGSSSVALFDNDNNPIAILIDIEIYKHNKEERIARTWGHHCPGLPYADEAITMLETGLLVVIWKRNHNWHHDGLDSSRFHLLGTS
ncbi:alpha tubulin suppressor [Datura stramonium]|uniref:Alpha tubulin suppressor n=1 Tax=Datura stramonium TaxID=4076 RepID=A0ABS8VNA2_DATST|nr:alpha tubulin suppressor [Datura stramonium]